MSQKRFHERNSMERVRMSETDHHLRQPLATFHTNHWKEMAAIAYSCAVSEVLKSSSITDFRHYWLPQMARAQKPSKITSLMLIPRNSDSPPHL